MKKDPRDYKVNGKQYSYILDCLRDCAYIRDGVETCESDRDLVSMFFKYYKDEFVCDGTKKRYPSEIERIAVYIQGQPSCMEIDYWWDNIVKIGKDWGYCQTPKKEEKFIDNWFVGIACHILQLKRILGA